MAASRLVYIVIRAITSLVRRVSIGVTPELFDQNYYEKQAQAVARLGLDPYLHYILFGVRKGLNPSSDFDTVFYRQQSGQTLLDPIRHYLRYGVPKNLDPSPNFSTKWYLEAYPDVVAGKVNPLLHFRKHGRREGRSASATSVQAAKIPVIAGVPAEFVVSLSNLQPSDRYFSISPIPVNQDIGTYTRRFCLFVSLPDDEIVLLLSSLNSQAKGRRFRVSFDARANVTRGGSANSIMLSFEHAYVFAAPNKRLVSYSEVQIWDLRVETPRVAAIFSSGFFTLGPHQ